MEALRAIIILSWIAITIANVVAMINIIQKAGYSGWNVLWAFVPILNQVMFFVFAFRVWPIESKLAMAKQPWTLGEVGNRQ